MDKNKLAEEEAIKRGFISTPAKFNFTQIYIAGFDAATEQANHINLTLHEKITELEQQLKEHRESLRKSVNRSADLSEQLKKADKIIEQVDMLAVHGYKCEDKGLTGKCSCYMYSARQYLKSRGE